MGLLNFFFKRRIKKDILLIDKPKGMSSFDVIRVLRKKLGIKKMGHAGTLDPLASGLLIIGAGKGTKKLNEFLRLPKTYIIEVLLGKQTDTGDLEGKIINEREVGKISREEVEKVLKSMEGEVELTVPIYSALKLKGKPYYHYARKGIKIDLPKRKMKIFKLKLLNGSRSSVGKSDFPNIKKDQKDTILKVEMDCGHGTYARSVAEEIGKRLGYPATVKELRRTKVGEWLVEKAERL